MKQKVFISGLCLTLALSLVACGGQQTGPEPQEPKQEVQQTEPVTTEPTVEPIEVKQEVKPVNPTAPVEGEPNTGNEVDPVGTDGEAEPAVQLFTEVNETVWATGTVNLRSGPSTEDEKVGALNKGNSVTRIGIGTGDYASWSKVKLSDGSEVYVASNYLSTTKPATSSTGSGATGQSNKGQSGEGSSGATIVDDNNPGISSTDPTQHITQEELTQGIDPNQNPWDVQGEMYYGGN